MAHIEVYTERRGLIRKRLIHRWRVRAKNGRILAVSSEGYYNLGDLWNAVRTVNGALGGSLGRTVPIHDGPPP